MREAFEDAYYLVCDVLEAAGDVIRLAMRFLIFATIPVWILPYTIIKEKKEEDDG